MFSGGVAEYIYGRERREFGDLGPRLAEAVRRGAQDAGIRLLEPREAIRATCIGASQYVVQLSGDTIFLSYPDHLPLRNVPVAAIGSVAEPSADRVARAVRQALVRLDLSEDGEDRFALALQWRHGADYKSLRALCQGIVQALPDVKDGRPLLLVVDADVAASSARCCNRNFRSAEAWCASTRCSYASSTTSTSAAGSPPRTSCRSSSRASSSTSQRAPLSCLGPFLSPLPPVLARSEPPVGYRDIDYDVATMLHCSH